MRIERGGRGDLTIRVTADEAFAITREAAEDWQDGSDIPLCIANMVEEMKEYTRCADCGEQLDGLGGECMNAKCEACPDFEPDEEDGTITPKGVEE